MGEFKVIDYVDLYLTSRSYEDIDDDGKPMTIEAVTNYHEKERVDLELPIEVVDHYRVIFGQVVTEQFTDDIAENGIQNPLRIYTNGTKAVLRDGHHRLIVAHHLGIETLPVHLVPNWLERVYDEYELPDLEPLVRGWLDSNLDFTHQGHQTKRAELNHRVTRVYCSCGADWRETSREPWERVTGGAKM